MSFYEDHECVQTADWLGDNLDRFRTDDPDYRLIEVDMDPQVYDEWHIPGAVSIDWEDDIVTGLGGSVIDADEASSLFGDLGITRDTTVVLYGDRANWFAGHAYWVLKYYGHESVQLLDGGRRYWRLQDLPTDTDQPSYSARAYEIDGTNEDIRAYKGEVEDAIENGTPIVDVRNPQEYRGEKPPAEIPNTTEREGHIPTADNVPWGEAVSADGRFKPIEALEDIYGEYVDEGDGTVAYCRIGERSSVTWFVLSELLDADAANYDGSWTEWANDQTMPVEQMTPTEHGGED